MTYTEAYNKIIEAYFKDEIKPYDSNFCFCGTLAGNSAGWNRCTPHTLYRNQPHNDYGPYTGVEYARMERALLPVHGEPGEVRYENQLFIKMSAALDVLKQIHIERGEVIDEVVTPFVKRELQLAK